jgi:hypothetical protein
MNKDIIGAQHEFHDKDFSIAWAERFVPTPGRLELFNIILSELQALIPVGGRVVELGIGPGYLASHLLGAMPNIEYCGIDFSRPMLEIASSRLKSYASRVAYLQADLVEDDWASMVAAPINAIVSTWALHDLGSQKNVEIVYEKSAKSLSNRGVLLNGDFIKPEGAIHDFEPGRFQIDRHLELLTNVGFSSVKCLARLEEEIDSPTPAQNYACFRAVN